MKPLILSGGILAGILCSMRAESPSLISSDKPFFFKFAMMASSAFPPPIQVERYSTKVWQIKEKMETMGGFFLPPTMHIYGKLDPIVDPAWSKEFAQIFPEGTRVEYEHDGKHFVPVTPEARGKYKEFLDKFRS